MAAADVTRRPNVHLVSPETLEEQAEKKRAIEEVQVEYCEAADDAAEYAAPVARRGKHSAGSKRPYGFAAGRRARRKAEKLSRRRNRAK